MYKYLLALPLCFFGSELIEKSLLFQADQITKKYASEVAKTAPPSLSPQPQICLDRASVWFTIDLREIEAPAFAKLSDEGFWNDLRGMGVEGVELQNLKNGLKIDPKWGSGWEDVYTLIHKKGFAFIGNAMPASTKVCADFILALRNVGEYPGLYHLIEIEKRDWKLLPCNTANVPWLSLQELQKKGYVPEQFAPYTKLSRWNATDTILGADGKTRRWIYLINDKSEPVIDWLNGSFAGARIATSDMLDSIYSLGQTILRIDEKWSGNARETLTLWGRKLGASPVQDMDSSVESLTANCADLAIDRVTASPLLEASKTGRTALLKHVYRQLLSLGVETKRLVHILPESDPLLAFFYLMQPGVFSFSHTDLQGVSLHGQLGNQLSLASKIGQCLEARRSALLYLGQLIAVPDTINESAIVLVHRLKSNDLQLVAINFGPCPVTEKIKMEAFKNTTAIDLMSGLAEPKPLRAADYLIEIPARSGKVIHFQPKYSP